MIEHPVPQNITSYEFRLVGSMTLKQFFELMVGLVLAFIIYRTNLYPLLKWPLIIAFVTFGVSLAFVPIQERPLDQWFMAFIRAIYNPTKFYWRRTVQAPEVFSNQSVNLTKYQDQEQALATAVAQKRSRASAYLDTLGATPVPAPLDADEDLRASGILALFDEVRVPVQSVRVTPLQAEEDLTRPDMEIKPRSLRTTLVTEVESAVEASEVVPITTQQSPTKMYEVSLPQSLPIVMEDFSSSSSTPETKEVVPAGRRPVSFTVESVASQTPGVNASTATEEVVKSQSLPFPNPPKQPNVLAGMVLDATGKLLDNAIIEVRTEQGVPVRAIKSNKLGQFFTSSPLPTGTYQMVIEKAGYRFEPYRLTVQNTVISPLEIRAMQAVQ